jgi:hypothetical protein
MADNAKPSLLSKLVKDAGASVADTRSKKKKPAKGAKIGFADAMAQMGHTSVFDIIRGSKPAFIKSLAVLSDADGDQAYENALCYASQIAQSWRREQVSSGRKQVLTQRTGIRSLVDIGPSYPNLFKENWDQFCKVGAIAAVDSPVAYLNSLYTYIKREIEQTDATDAGARDIPLDTRRPDIKALMLDQQTTYTPIPMLNIVHQVLSTGINEYLTGLPDSHPDKGRTVSEVLNSKQHPFQFPYDFHHHQIMLGLSAKNKPRLGELNYRLSLNMPVYGAENTYGCANDSTPVSAGLVLLSGLSVAQQTLITEPSLFTTFYVCRDDLTGGDSVWWHSSSSQRFCMWKHERTTNFAFVIPQQDEVENVEPSALELITSAQATLELNKVTLTLTPSQATIEVNARSHYELSAASHAYQVNAKKSTSGVMTFELQGTDALLGIEEHEQAGFYAVLTKEGALDGVDFSRRDLLRQSFCIDINPESTDDYKLSPEEQDYFKSIYGADVISTAANPLSNLKYFMSQAGLSIDQLNQLLSVADQFPKVSDNLQQAPSSAAYYPGPLPSSLHYGACYVNGTGGREPGMIRLTDANAAKDSLLFGDCSMGLIADAVGTPAIWRLTNATLNRFDRMQRMIRLQRWTTIPFAELDTLIMAAIHSERESNLLWELNKNTLRAIGVYQYLSSRYGLKPEEFAAFMHFITPYATGDRSSLFDRVFNSPALFDTPLMIDGTPFSFPAGDALSAKTIAQLCAGLGIEPTEHVFGLLADDIKTLIASTVEGEAAKVGLTRSFPVISSFYRQARIAKLFGLSVQDCWGLIDLLGGEDYRRAIVRGALRSATATEEYADILDILMQMDWAVSWLAETKRTVAALRIQLSVDPDPEPVTQALLDQLNQMRKDLDAVLLNEEQLDSLNLPPVINWWDDVLTATKVRDVNGLVRTVASADLQDPMASISAVIEKNIDGIVFSEDSEQQQAIHDQVLSKLVDFVVGARNAQLRLTEGLLQSLAGLSMDRTEVVARLAGSGGTSLLSGLIGATATQPIAFPLIESALTLTDKLRQTCRCAVFVQQLGISAKALRTFLIKPTWLHPQAGTELTFNFATLYALDRYSQWLKEASVPEDQVLAYFDVANAASAPTPATCNELLAVLIGAARSQVQTISGALPDGIATSMMQVDWVRRVYASSESSGLSVDALLKATTLTPDSPAQAWQEVGEAAMAASR